MADKVKLTNRRSVRQQALGRDYAADANHGQSTAGFNQHCEGQLLFYVFWSRNCRSTNYQIRAVRRTSSCPFRRSGSGAPRGLRSDRQRLQLVENGSHSRAKETIVRFQKKAIRHPCDVIADYPNLTIRILVRSIGIKWQERFRIRSQGFED